MTVGDAATLIMAMAWLLNAIVAVAQYFRQRNADRVMLLLEKNTNSIKDALVKVTGEAERAKGVLEGKATKGDSNV